MKAARRFGVTVLLGLVACAGDDGSSDPQLPPTSPSALIDWIDGGFYEAWDSESAVHAGAGPHFGDVLTYVNTALVTSLEGASAEHPAGCATVKELYGDGTEVLGHSVSVKTAAGTDASNWYWFEHFEGNTLADGDGIQPCEGCHLGGSDYVLTPFPLQ